MSGDDYYEFNTPDPNRIQEPIEFILDRRASVTQRHSTALNGTQRHWTALNGTQRHSTALNGTQSHSMALNDTQRHSTALNGTQLHTDLGVHMPQKYAPTVLFKFVHGNATSLTLEFHSSFITREHKLRTQSRTAISTWSFFSLDKSASTGSHHR